jgi:hypothetical protein
MYTNLLVLAISSYGGVVEWLKAADCKSARVSVRRFESYPLHQNGGYGLKQKSECVMQSV